MLRCLAGLMILALAAPAQEAQDRVDRVFDKIEESRGAALWEGIRELDELGRPALPAVRKGLTRADPWVRIAVAKVLYTNEQRDDAVDAIAKVMGGKNAAAKRAAADMAASLVGTDRTLSGADRKKISETLQRHAESSDDPLAQVALWRAVWNLTEGIQAPRQVRDLFNAAERPEVREEAALALAEMDRFEWARTALFALSREPSERGRMARAYVKVNELTAHISRQLAAQAGKSSGKYDFRLLEETLDVLKAAYHDEGKIIPDKLIEAAVRGACASLDPYTTYMTEEMIDQLKKEDLAGQYGGIGARVMMRRDKTGNSWLTISEPIFSGPAYAAGLRSGDTIQEVEGEPTRNKELYDLVRRLRGKPDTKVTFKVWRRGWTKEREFSLARKVIQLETTMHRMLPGEIGYIKLATFGEQDVDLVARAIKDMPDMKSLVFDLRGNSGGYLRTAQKIAGYFLDKGQTIVTTRGRGVEQEHRRSEGGRLTDRPVIMLVDEGSASASEILAGALQDHKRALLVGQKTFGKGSVQDMKYFKTTDEKTAVKVTISKWFLPSGRTVEGEKLGEGGIAPDIQAGDPERDFWKDAEFERLRAGDDMDKYLRDQFPANKELFGRLAEADGADATRYPGYDALYESLKTRASKEDVRELLRDMVRTRVQDDRGKPLYFDFQMDTVLQRGIMEACKLAKVDAKTIREYDSFSRLPEKQASDNR